MNATETSRSIDLRPGRKVLTGKAAGINVSACMECGTPLAAQLADLARRDLLLLADRPLRYGTPLRVALFSDLVSSVVYTRSAVHFCRATHHGWQIGAFLSQPLSDHMVERFWDDLRGQLRYECDWKAWVLSEDDGGLKAVRIIGYSLNGVRMLMERPAEPGTWLGLYGSAGNRDRGLLRARVEWTRRIEGQTVVGCFIPGHRGRELPKLFSNLADLHVGHSESSEILSRGHGTSTSLIDLAEQEHFLPRSM